MKKIIAVVALMMPLLWTPFLASATGGLFTITSLTNGFVITANDDTIPIGITINKGFWENQILKHDGTITASVSSGAGTISQTIEWLAPVVPHNSAGSITAYSGGVVLDTNSLRSTTTVPIIVLVEARNQQGKVIASAKVRGTIVPAHRFTVSLSGITPPSTYYERGNTFMNYSAIVFTAGPYDNVGVQQITVTRSGGTDTDLLNIQLFDGATRRGRADGFSGGKAVITLDWPFFIPEGTSKVLMIKADIDPNATVCRIQDGISLGIADFSDVEAINIDTGSILVPGNFIPVFGNPMGIQ
ncbi:MAG: hypothetical protein Q7R88_01600 [bacterium]|nr:hypothetical protein [bacterium]